MSGLGLWRRADSIFPRRGVIGPIATFRVGSCGQTLLHCHDACIAPDHGAQEQGGSRAPAQSPALRTLRRDAASGNGPAGAYAAWALLGGLGRPGWSGMYSQNPRGWKTGLAVFQRARNAPRCCCRAGTTRCPIVERRGARGLRKAGQGPGRQAQGCAAQGGGRAERNRSWSVLSGPEDSDPSCLFFFPACRGLYAACGSAYARLPVMDAAVAIGLAFECVPDPGWLSAVVCAKPRALPCAFAISRRAAGFARRALCFACALAACLEFSALDPVLPVAFLFRRT